MTIVLNFFKKFVLKYATSIVLEKLLILSLKELVGRTDSKFDDEIYKTIFEKTKVSE